MELFYLPQFNNQQLIMFCLFASFVLLLLAGWDKLQAKRQKRRVPEKVLLWGAFFGGALGLWLAMTWFRHKTNKPVFYYLTPLLAILQWGLLLYWGGIR